MVASGGIGSTPGPGAPPSRSVNVPSSATSRSSRPRSPHAPGWPRNPQPSCSEMFTSNSDATLPVSTYSASLRTAAKRLSASSKVSLRCTKRGKSGSFASTCHRSASCTSCARCAVPSAASAGSDACATSSRPTRCRPSVRSDQAAASPAGSELEGEATGHAQRLARDERGLLRAEVENRVHDVAHLAATVHELVLVDELVEELVG